MNLGHVFATAANAVLPILLLILLGYGLKRTGFFTEKFIRIGNKLVFRLCLPAMLFVNVYDIEGFSVIKWDVVIYAVAIICVLFLIGLGLALVSTKVPERRGVVMQCVFRSNFAIIGLPLAGALGGESALAVTAVISAFSIPFFNIFAIIALTVFLDHGTDGKREIRKILLGIAKNPLVVAVVGALAVLGLRQLQTELFGEVVFSLSRDVKFLYTAIDNLKSIASPFALIVLGGQFEFSAVKGLFKEIVIGSVSRLVVAPLIGVGCAVLLSTHTNLLSCTVNEYPALIALFGSPVAVSSAVMAGEMNNDEQLATQLVVWTSAFSILTIFLSVCIMMPAGLLAG